jgi:glycogen synthase
MRVLMTTDTIGGVWTYSVLLGRALELSGHQVLLASMGLPAGADQRRQARTIANLRLVESRYKLEWMHEPWDDLRRAGRWLRKLAAAWQPDIVHLNQYAHGELDWPAPVVMVGHSCVLSWHAAVRGSEAPKSWARYARVVRRGLQSADVVVTPTRTMCQWTQRYYGPLRESRVIPNGGDASRFVPARKDAIVLAAGRIWDEAKNLHLLAALAPRLDWPVLIAGDDTHPDGGRVRCDGVRLLGRLTEDQMAAALGGAAIFVHPARYEPFGLAVLEAALAGCALVLSDIPTLRELWHDAACFVPPDDKAALASAIARLVNRSPLRDDLAGRARRRARNYSLERMANNYAALYREQIAARAQCQPGNNATG